MWVQAGLLEQAAACSNNKFLNYNLSMIKNYFKIAWRNIVKSRFYAVVNITGLAVGITAALVIGAFVWSEVQVNKQLRNADRQYFIKS